MIVQTKEDYYAVLEIEVSTHISSVDILTIKRAFKKLALVYHPDKGRPAGEVIFKVINRAYEILSNSDQKVEYDAWYTRYYKRSIVTEQHIKKEQKRKHKLEQAEIKRAEKEESETKKEELERKRKEEKARQRAEREKEVLRRRREEEERKQAEKLRREQAEKQRIAEEKIMLEKQEKLDEEKRLREAAANKLREDVLKRQAEERFRHASLKQRSEEFQKLFGKPGNEHLNKPPLSSASAGSANTTGQSSSSSQGSNAGDQTSNTTQSANSSQHKANQKTQNTTEGTEHRGHNPRHTKPERSFAIPRRRKFRSQHISKSDFHKKIRELRENAQSYHSEREEYTDSVEDFDQRAEKIRISAEKAFERAQKKYNESLGRAAALNEKAQAAQESADKAHVQMEKLLTEHDILFRKYGPIYGDPESNSEKESDSSEEEQKEPTSPKASTFNFSTPNASPPKKSFNTKTNPWSIFIGNCRKEGKLLFGTPTEYHAQLYVYFQYVSKYYVADTLIDYCRLRTKLDGTPLSHESTRSSLQATIKKAWEEAVKKELEMKE